MEFRQAHIRRQRQLQASGGGEPLGKTNAVCPAPPATINCLGTALDNLALAAANNTTVLQQLTSANLALIATNTALSTANRKLLDALAKLQATRPPTLRPPPTSIRPSGPPPPSTKPYPGNYCWTHGYRVNQMHMSATCGRKAPGHQDLAMASNTMGGNKKDKGWDTRHA